MPVTEFSWIILGRSTTMWTIYGIPFKVRRHSINLHWKQTQFGRFVFSLAKRMACHWFQTYNFSLILFTHFPNNNFVQANFPANLSFDLSKTTLPIPALDDPGRRSDIFVGVDVFGRGCLGGGGFQCNVALEEIRKRKLSAAIFGPGWTHEVNQTVEISWVVETNYFEWLPTFRKYDISLYLCEKVLVQQLSIRQGSIM